MVDYHAARHGLATRVRDRPGPWTLPPRSHYKLTVWYRPDPAVWGGWTADDQSNATFAVSADGAILHGEGRPFSLFGRFSAQEADILAKIRAEMARLAYSASRQE
jgi:hypothetical protein